MGMARGSSNTINLQNCKPNNVVLDRSFSLKHMLEVKEPSSRPNSDTSHKKQDTFVDNNNNIKVVDLGLTLLSVPEPRVIFSPTPASPEQQASAVKIQKVYKSYRTRRNLADCAVVVEELWWKAINYASLSHSSVSFYNNDKPQTVVSRWARARKRVAQFAKGLSKDDKAQKLALQHWLEAIDPRHRYGHNLHLYYNIWFQSESTEPFFYWLDIGQGKDVVHEKCPRSPLYRQCIKYLGPNEREAYQVIVEDGKLIYKLRGEAVNTDEDSKWIFVLSTSRLLYVGRKKKGTFQHSSFLAGAATTAAGRLVARDGILEAIWPYSGHYHPTEENFREFITFLEEHNVDLSNVKRCSTDDDNSYTNSSSVVGPTESRRSDSGDDATYSTTKPEPIAITKEGENVNGLNQAELEKSEFEFCLARKWSTGAGPRIGIVRDYPMLLQTQALEQVNLSPRVGLTPAPQPIPSPRPSPKVRVSPRLAYMGHPSPRTPKLSAY